MTPQKQKPFDLNLDDSERTQLADELCREIADAFSARASIIDKGGLIDLADWFYEQGRSDPSDRPFPGAADLTSYIITENVDAMQARLLDASFGVRPFCFVEGRGADASKAQRVEAFTDWQVRKSDLQEEAERVLLGALLEDCYVLEVSEKIETRRMTDTIDAKVETNELGGPVLADGRVQVHLGPDGEPVPAEPGQPSAKIERTMVKTKRLGPQYDAISMKDFVFLPGHAKSQKQVWGYAYRFTARVPELQEKAKDGIYDAAAVDAIGAESDRSETNVTSAVDGIASQEGPSAEKELYQVSLKRDLDEDGREEWYVATISLKSRTLLRLKLDKFCQKVGMARCVPLVLFPRRNSVYGYSYAFDKLMTLAEEHTSLRNMKADRGALATNAPMTQIANGMADLEAEPFGIGRVIHVRTHDELKQMVIADVPVSVVEQERAILAAKERVGGLSDGAGIGVTSQEHRTATENRIVAAGSGVRVKVVAGRVQRWLARVMYLSHAIWLETLEGDQKGLEAPKKVADGLGPDFGGAFTFDDLKGDFAFEPYGSDETADPQWRKSNFDNAFMALANLGKVFPGIQRVLADPEVSNAVLEQWGRAYDVRDMAPFKPKAPAELAPAPNAGMGPAPMGEPAGGAPALPPELMALLHANAQPQEGTATGGY